MQKVDATCDTQDIIQVVDAQYDTKDLMKMKCSSLLINEAMIEDESQGQNDNSSSSKSKSEEVIEQPNVLFKMSVIPWQEF